MVQTPRTLLIVDDSPEDQELYRRYLGRDGNYAYTILDADLGKQGLHLWQQHQPDVVLLDYRLPDLNGLEFLTKLQSLCQEVCLPVIMVTGQGNEAIAVQAMKAGAQDYLVKEQITPEGLHLAVNNVIETVHLRTQLQQRIERERLVAQITRKIHQSLDLNEILQTTVTEVRQFLQADRVLVFRLQAAGWGIVTTESVDEDWPALLSSSYYDPCLNEQYVEPFRQGHITIKPDIYDGSVSPCHVELLARLKVRANLVVPILQRGQLWGMLMAHHCSGPRQWQAIEIDLLKELATQVGIALQQAELYQQAQSELAERKQTEKALHDNEQLLRLALAGAQAGSWDWEISTGTVSWSPENYDLYGLDPNSGSLQYDDWCNTLHPDDQERARRDVFSIVEKKLPEFRSEFRIVHARRGVRWLLAMGRLTFNGQGEPMRLSGINIDITDRKNAEIERDRLLQREQSARVEAERANRIKDEFLAILSHELRSPLNPILGWTKLLQIGKLSPPDTAQALKTIERNVYLQTQLIDELLDIAKILRGKLTMQVGPVNLVQVIHAAIDTVQATALAKNIDLQPVLPSVGQVSGDAVRLQQVIWNLLSNAIKFTPEGGRVNVRLEEVMGHGLWSIGAESLQASITDDPLPITSFAQITITDTGKGIHSDFLPHIFESFRQEDASTTRKFGGLGLGLAIARQLVEAHGGTITASSLGEGLGATFIVRLPLINAVEQAPEPPEIWPGQEANLAGIRVLAVDDDLDSRELLEVILGYGGAEVLTVASAIEALEIFHNFKPDLLISDIGMPNIDGYTLIQQIRALPPEEGGQVLAIAVTAYAKDGDREQALASGFQEHIIKPLDPSAFIQQVSKVVKLSACLCES